MKNNDESTLQLAVGDAVPEGIKSPAEVGETKAFNLENPTLEEYQEAFEHSFDMAPSSMVNIHIIHETPPDQALMCYYLKSY